jgi:hypothetical protein
MAIQVSEYINIQERALELNCNVPTGLALLPRNFAVAPSKEALVYAGSTEDIRKLWYQTGIVETKLEKVGESFSYIEQERAAEWLGPIIFIGTSLLSGNQELVSIALGVISNYLTDWFKGKGHQSNNDVEFDIVVEHTKGRSYSRIHVKGDVERVNKIDMPQIIQKLRDSR